MSISPAQVYAGIDWLTLTTGPTGDADEAYQRARALAVEAVDAKNRLRPWSSHGYRGFSVPHLRCGHKDGDVLVELSGALAEARWREFLPFAKNVTRIDPQVTVTFPRRVDDLAVQAYDAPAKRMSPNLPPISKRIFLEKDGGQTCYLGAPTSDRRARLYDKHIESAGEYPPNTWRYELQVRRAMGSDLARLIDGSDDVHRSVASVVHSFFSAHGVSPWFSADGPTVFSPARRSRSDMSRWLDWLRRSVRPGVRRWSDRATRRAIIDALGLDELADPVTARELTALVTGSDMAKPRRHIKESAPCQKDGGPDDLTPPRTSSGSTANSHHTPTAPDRNTSASAAPAWPQTSHTAST